MAFATDITRIASAATTGALTAAREQHQWQEDQTTPRGGSALA